MTPPSDPTPEAPQQPPVSLKELSEAFAQAVGGSLAATAEDRRPAEQPADQPDQQREDDGTPPPQDDQPPAEEETPRQVSPRSIFEAMLFVGNRQNEPLTAARAAALMRGVEPGEIPALVEELNRRYAAGESPLEIVGRGAGYRITLRNRFNSLRNRFYGRAREARLSQAAIDVLAIVAYRQPLTSDEVSRLRDRPSGSLLTQLVRRRLLRVERAAEKPRRVHYYTTDRFLHLFGLESLDDLPQAE